MTVLTGEDIAAAINRVLVVVVVREQPGVVALLEFASSNTHAGDRRVTSEGTGEILKIRGDCNVRHL